MSYLRNIGWLRILSLCVRELSLPILKLVPPLAKSTMNFIMSESTATLDDAITNIAPTVSFMRFIRAHSIMISAAVCVFPVPGGPNNRPIPFNLLAHLTTSLWLLLSPECVDAGTSS